MSLPNDVSRCVGRFGLRPRDKTCPRRGECQRYLAMLSDEFKGGYPDNVSVATGLCRHDRETLPYLIPVDPA